MKNFTFLKVLVSIVLTMLVVGTQAQLRQVKLYCSDDWTIDQGHPEAGIDWGNNLCNNDDDGSNGNGYQEAWMKWDFSSIELADGEEIISAELLLRAAYNANGQGFHAIVLDDKYDNWLESDFGWTKALALGDFITEGGDTAMVTPVANQMNVYLPGENLVTEKFSMLQYVQKEMAGDKVLTLRMKPYYDTFKGDDKKWLGYYNRQPHSTWDQTMGEAPNENISAWAPYLKVLIAVPAEQFSTEDVDFGNINNYNASPQNSWFGIEDNTGEGRLLMLKNNSNNPDSIGASAIFKNRTDYTDFELTLDARVNDALSEMKTNVSIIFDYIDESNYSYFAFYGVGESSQDKLNGVYKVIDNIRSIVGESIGGMAIQDDEYHTYTVGRSGSRVTASVDGVIFHVVDDASLAGGSGAIGFGSAKFLVNFDNVKEKSLGTSVSFKTKTSFISIFPNPVKNTTVINSDEIINTVKVLNIVGKSVITVPNVNSKRTSLNLSNLPSGVYIIATESNGKWSSGKLIKE